jgi:hypothetical protein
MKAPKDYLAWAALAAALGVSASAEWQLAVACGFGPAVAVGVPAALDVYAVRALRARRDVPAVVGALIVVQALAHLVNAHVVQVNAALIVAVSTIAPLVLWRVHRIGHTDPDPAAPAVASPQENHTVVHQDTPVFTQVNPVPALAALPEVTSAPDQVDAEPVRLDAEAAREAIEAAWREGLSIREAATRATRSPSYVQGVYAQLGKADTGPIPGQLAIDAA